MSGLKTGRRLLFWGHLTLGLTGGLPIALLCVTGALLGFEKQIIDRVDLPARFSAQVFRSMKNRPPALSTKAAMETVERMSAAPVAAITRYSEPGSATLLTTGPNSGKWVDLQSGEVRPLASERWRALFHRTKQLHRMLGGERPKRRELGRTVTGFANVLLLLLVLSGLYLWWPSRWTRTALSSALWFRRGLAGRARDWSWH